MLLFSRVPIAMPMTDRITSLDLRVRYAETDQMGVVYHSNYLVWCEIGRTELLRQRGRTYAELERDGVLLAVADVSIRFHAPAQYDDLVRVETWVSSLRSRTISFNYQILNVTDEDVPVRLATAHTLLVVLDRDRKPRALPATIAELLR